jgi:hypothetical protein
MSRSPHPNLRSLQLSLFLSVSSLGPRQQRVKLPVSETQDEVMSITSPKSLLRVCVERNNGFGQDGGGSADAGFRYHL